MPLPTPFRHRMSLRSLVQRPQFESCILQRKLFAPESYRPVRKPPTCVGPRWSEISSPLMYEGVWALQADQDTEMKEGKPARSVAHAGRATALQPAAYHNTRTEPGVALLSLSHMTCHIAVQHLHPFVGGVVRSNLQASLHLATRPPSTRPRPGSVFPGAQRNVQHPFVGPVLRYTQRACWSITSDHSYLPIVSGSLSLPLAATTKPG